MADRVELIVQLTGNQQAISSLREMQQLVNNLNTKKVQLKLDAAEIDRQLADKQRALKELTARKHEIKMSGGDVTQVSRLIDKLKEEIADLTQQKKHVSIDARLNTEALSQGNAELREMQQNAFTVADAIRGIGTALSTVGSLSSSVGSIFGQMASLAGGDMMSTVTRTLTGYGTILATQGLGTATSRFDTFRTFPRVMEVMGYSIDQTDAAVKRLEASVLGLPTSLNDIIDMARDFILLTNDLDRGVDLATSINNLFVAGGADSEQVRIGLKQFRDLLSKGSLMDREWDSLARTLGVSLRFIASEAGYAEEEFGEFRTALKSGEIAVSDFLDAVVRAGSSGRVKGVLEEMKDTLTATLANLRTAFANLGATVLTEVDALFTRRTGGGLPDAILAISNAIKQQLIPAVREWIALNADRLFAVFDWLRSFDWGALLRGIADNILYVVEKLLAFADAIGHENIIWFFSHGTQWSMMARQFSTLGGVLSTVGGAVSTVGGAIGGILNAFASLNYLTGGALAGQLAGIAGAFSGIGAAAAYAAPALGAAAAAVGVAVMALTQWDRASERREQIAREKFGFDDIDAQIGAAEQTLARYEDLVARQDASLDVVEQRVAHGKRLIQEILDLGAQANTQSELNLLATKVAELQELFPDIKIELDEVTRRLTLNGRVAAEAAGSLVEYAGAIETVEIATQAIDELRSENLQLEIEFAVNENNLKNLKAQLDTLLKNPVERSTVYGADNSEYWQYVAEIEALKEKIAELEGAQDGLSGAMDDNQQRIGAWTDKMNEAAAAADANASAVTGAVEGTTSAVAALEAKYKELKKAAQESFATQIEGFGELEQAATEKIGSMIDAQNKNAEYIETYNKNLRTLKEYIEENGAELSPNVARMLSEAVSDGLEGAGSVAAIAEAIEADDESFQKLAAAYEKEFEAAAKAADLTAAVQTLASAFTDAYDKTLAEGSLFGEDGLTLFSETDLEKIKTEASKMVAQLQTGINEIFASGGDDATAGITLFSEDTIKAMITPMYEALMSEDTGLAASFTALRDLMVSISDETIPYTIEQSDALREAVDALREAIEELIDVMNDLIDTIDEANKETNTWRRSIERLTGTIRDATPAVAELSAAIAAFTGEVFAAVTAVSELVSAVSGLSGLSIDIPVNISGAGAPAVSGGLSPNFSGSAIAQPFAKGGPVYLARGGAFWKPRGTDTVPAMLTPGEFVMRRKAVQKLGVPFMDMINRLDIPHAIDALMSRVILPSAMSYVTYDNRRTYDNHATVNQNIYTNNPDYAYRRASRWAHAL